jgi:hypothetical protein
MGIPRSASEPFDCDLLQGIPPAPVAWFLKEPLLRIGYLSAGGKRIERIGQVNVDRPKRRCRLCGARVTLPCRACQARGFGPFPTTDKRLADIALTGESDDDVDVQVPSWIDVALRIIEIQYVGFWYHDSARGLVWRHPWFMRKRAKSVHLRPTPDLF